MGVFESNEGSQNHLHESCSLARELQHIRIGDPSEQYNSRNSDLRNITAASKSARIRLSCLELQHFNFRRSNRNGSFLKVVHMLKNYRVSKIQLHWRRAEVAEI
ncbi:uncharacterized protein LOC126610713 [Malus sylvestris]|uniref:uncharacterized protein LOC126610713 n=1 Tax=Malus sylvestris TaxID=3752 RepID=UPI0007ED7B70|nr:uncharacterized protein LOC126610713 [Malus sylvestris]